MEASMTTTTERASVPPATRARDLGICCTCNHRETCTRRRTWIGPVFHCEEFDDFVDIPRRGRVDLAKAEEPEARPSARSEAHRGLCVNCAHRDTCTFSKPEGGVWHCEEYE